ncbi:MAG: hypothetical protein AAF567_09025 [Actinomycetota bacterium]
MPTDVEPTSHPAIGERLGDALRQAAVFVAASVFGALLLDRIRPEEATDRDIFTTPYAWAAALWIVVLVFHAIAFDRPQLGAIQREPLMLALGVAIITLFIGILQFDAGSAAERFGYLLVNAVGTALFWWAAFALVQLLNRAVRSAS